ncbi:MAG: aspartate kinase, partial [Oscillospiraceae bacterium]
MLVCKFGGSSLSDSTQFSKVREIVRENTERKVIVLSAPGKRYKNDTKITDLLYHCCTRANNNKAFDRDFNEIRERFMEIAENCSIDIDLESELAEIYDTIATTKDADYGASRGEYLSAKLMSRYLGFTFVDAKDLIFFNEDSTVNEEETYRNINNAVIENGRIAIPGFYGSLNGSIKTFSRGGSDITGALAAAATNACLYENWTDVSGILMADPKIVMNPMAIESISYSQLRELAHAGAGVLHEDAVSPAKRAGIPINIKNTNRPQDKGTIICNNSKGIRPIAGISGKRDFSIIAAESDNVAENFMCMRAVLDILAGFSVPVENVISDAEG